MKEMELRKAMYIPSAPSHLPLVGADTNLNVNSKPKPAKYLSAVKKKNLCVRREIWNYSVNERGGLNVLSVRCFPTFPAILPKDHCKIWSILSVNLVRRLYYLLNFLWALFYTIM